MGSKTIHCIIFFVTAALWVEEEASPERAKPLMFLCGVPTVLHGPEYREGFNISGL